MAGPDFGKQIGPLPLGAWVALVGGGLLIAGYSSTRGGGGSDTVEMTDTSGGYPGVGVGGTPAYTATGGQSTSLVPETVIEDNEQWGRFAIDELIRKFNYDPTLVTSAITKYLNSEGLSASEMTMVAAAIRELKSPPSPLIPRLSVSTPVVTTPVVTTPAPAPAPAPVAAPAPVPQPTERIYVVVKGDNLSKIAQRYYGRQDWQKIYNANRGVIGSNPNKIYPGQRLVIPY